MFVAMRTPFGRQVYAVGGNERAALLAGVRVARVRMRVYVISGFCAALVGVIIAAQLGAAHPATGETFELNAIAAVVLGGTSLMGGRGTITGTLIGAFVIGVLADGLVLLGVSEFWQMVVKGLVIVLAVILDQISEEVVLMQRHTWIVSLTALGLAQAVLLVVRLFLRRRGPAGAGRRKAHRRSSRRRTTIPSSRPRPMQRRSAPARSATRSSSTSTTMMRASRIS